MRKTLLVVMIMVSLLIAGPMVVMAQDTVAAEGAEEVVEVVKIDVNLATLEELETLPGIGPKTAQLIIDGRPYKVIEDLLVVKGIGEKKLEAIKDLIEVKIVEEQTAQE